MWRHGRAHDRILTNSSNVCSCRVGPLVRMRPWRRSVRPLVDAGCPRTIRDEIKSLFRATACGR